MKSTRRDQRKPASEKCGGVVHRSIRQGARGAQDFDRRNAAGRTRWEWRNRWFLACRGVPAIRTSCSLALACHDAANLPPHFSPGWCSRWSAACSFTVTTAHGAEPAASETSRTASQPDAKAAPSRDARLALNEKGAWTVNRHPTSTARVTWSIWPANRARWDTPTRPDRGCISRRRDTCCAAVARRTSRVSRRGNRASCRRSRGTAR